MYTEQRLFTKFPTKWDKKVGKKVTNNKAGSVMREKMTSIFNECIFGLFLQPPKKTNINSNLRIFLVVNQLVLFSPYWIFFKFTSECAFHNIFTV